MRFSCACDAIREDRDIEAVEEVLDGRGDLSVEEILLTSFMVVNGIEMEAEVLGGVARIGYTDDRLICDC